jgi:hypothetical protein
MKSKIRKISMFALIAGLLVTLAGRNIINAEEGSADEVVIEEQTAEEVVEKEETEVVENVADNEAPVQTLSTVAPMTTGVSTLVPETTTLGQAFPDANFRKWVAETGLSLSSYDENTVLTTANVNRIKTIALVRVSNSEIESLEGIKHFTGMTQLTASGNKLTELDLTGLSNLTTLTISSNEISTLNITGVTGLTSLLAHNNKLTSLDVSALSSLQTLQVSNNQLSSLDVSMLNSLVTLNVHENPISELNISNGSKATLATLHYRNTNIPSLDLTGFTALSTVSVTKSTGGNLSLLSGLQVSGSREWEDRYMIRLYYTTGALSRDTATNYYIIAPSMGVEYKFHIPLGDRVQGSIDTPQVGLPEGGILDDEGNLIVGANASNIAGDGTITLPTGGTIITPEGTFTFSGSVSIKDGIITTNDSYTYGKNTATYDEGTGTSTGNVGDVTTIVEPGEGSVSISTIGSESTIPEGTVITNDAGDKVYVLDGGNVDSEGNVTSNGTVISVPSDKVGSISTDGDGKISLPAGSVVSNNGEDVSYPGTIVYNPEDNSVKYLPVDELFNEDGTLKDGITQEDITNSKDFVNGLDDSALKTELQNKVEEAQKELDERNAQKAVEDLFDEDGNIKDTVTQEDIDNAQDLVNKVTDGDKKKELQDKLDEAQKQYDENHFILLEAFKTFTGMGTVSTKIDAPVEKFSKMYVDGKELDANNYEVTSGSTVITLNEAYLKTLANGTYDVEVEFVSGARVNSPLTVDVKSNPSKPPVTTDPTPTIPGNPTTSNPSIDPSNSSTSGSGVNSGDTTNNTLYYMMLVSSLAVLGLYAKKRKVVK